MIVKDEAHVLKRTLDCLLSHVKFDYYVVCDTGSTDGTQDLIKNYFTSKGIPGEVHQREWKNFGFNRSEAFSLAEGKSDYVFVFDADDYVHGKIDWPHKLDKDFYLFKFGPDFIYHRPLLFKNNLSWSFKCVLHEYAHSPLASTNETIDGEYFLESGRSGSRNKDQKEKREKDIKTLEEAIREEPENERYWFYLAEAYKDSEMYEKAVEAYEKRINLTGWDQETFFAFLQRANCLKALNRDSEAVVNAYLESFQFRPQRIEGLYEIGKNFRINNQFHQGLLFLSVAIKQKSTEDTLFIQKSNYEWEALDEYSICSFFCGFVDEALSASCEILNRRNFPEYHRERLEKNKMFALNQLRGEREKYPEEKINLLTQRNPLKEEYV